MIAPPGAVPAISSESDDLRFWQVTALPPETGDLTNAVGAALRRG